MADPQPETLDFTEVRRTTKTMRGKYMTLAWNSYRSDMLSLGLYAVERVCDKIDIPRRPSFMNLIPIKGSPRSYQAIPTNTETVSTVPVIWSNDGRKGALDVSLLLSAYPFPIPRGSRAYIPIEVSEDRQKLFIHFGKAEFRPMRRTKETASSESMRAAVAATYQA